MRRHDHKRGRWVILKHPDPFNPDTPWTVILWGGNGEHWADGAEVGTWAEAWVIAQQARAEFIGGDYGDYRYWTRFDRNYLS